MTPNCSDTGPVEDRNLSRIKKPVQREIQGLKNGAKWTMGAFKKPPP